jgi:hypothetical protein
MSGLRLSVSIDCHHLYPHSLAVSYCFSPCWTWNCFHLLLVPSLEPGVLHWPCLPQSFPGWVKSCHVEYDSIASSKVCSSWSKLQVSLLKCILWHVSKQVHFFLLPHGNCTAHHRLRLDEEVLVGNGWPGASYCCFCAISTFNWLVQHRCSFYHLLATVLVMW